LRAILLAAALATSALSCSGKKFMRVEDIPVPPSARREVIEGAYETRLDLAVADARRVLSERFGRADVEIFRLDAAAEWGDVERFYEERLGAAGLTRDSGYTTEHNKYKLAAWKLSGGDGLAVALIDAGTTDDNTPLKFLAVFRPTN
jgi:hypothetical protein